MSTAAEQYSVREQVNDDEWQVRVNLAACYRLIARFGWDDLIFTHISARVPGPDDHFLINAYGLMFEEMTASSLVKVDINGEIIQDTPYFINPAGFTIHSAIHAARQDRLRSAHPHESRRRGVGAERRSLADLADLVISLRVAGLSRLRGHRPE